MIMLTIVSVIKRINTNGIYDTEDLEQFADGRDINEFDVSYADLEEV